MADFEPKNDLDLRYGGSTLGDFAYFYDVELPWLFKCINSIRRNQAHPSGASVEPVPYQIKIEDDKLYVRNKNDTDWVFLLNITNWGGILSIGEDILVESGLIERGETILTDSDIPAAGATAQQKVGKIVVYNSNGDVPGVLLPSDKAGNTAESRANKLAVYNEAGVLPANITGSAAKIGGKPLDLSGAQDGQVLTYNSTLDSWTPTDKFSGVGQGKSLTFIDSKGAIGQYNGGATTVLDMPVDCLLPDMAYNVGDMARTNQLATGMAMVCVSAGTTPATIPSLAGE